MAANRYALALACVLGLSACTSAGGGPGGANDKRSGFDSLTGDEMCRMLPLDLVQRHFPDVEFYRTKGRVTGRDGGAFGSTRGVDCHYGGDSLGLDTTVQRTLGGRDVDAHLDLEFTDVNDQVIDFRRVSGLGSGAGFGRSPGLGDIASSTLAVIFDAGSGQYKLELSTIPDAQLRQLKPLAEALLPRIQDALS